MATEWVGVSFWQTAYKEKISPHRRGLELQRPELLPTSVKTACAHLSENSFCPPQWKLLLPTSVKTAFAHLSENSFCPPQWKQLLPTSVKTAFTHLSENSFCPPQWKQLLPTSGKTLKNTLLILETHSYRRQFLHVKSSLYSRMYTYIVVLVLILIPGHVLKNEKYFY